MISYLTVTPAHILSAVGLLLASWLAVLLIGRSWGAAVRDACVRRKLAWRDGRIRELQAALDRAEQAAETAGDRARSATAQALASATLIREATDRLAEQVGREINKTLAAVSGPPA